MANKVANDVSVNLVSEVDHDQALVGHESEAAWSRRELPDGLNGDIFHENGLLARLEVELTNLPLRTDVECQNYVRVYSVDVI